MKQAGKCRFVGISGHNLPARFIPFLEHGEHNTGIVAMKVFGAPDPKTGSWGTRKALPRVDIESVELAIRYALGNGRPMRATSRSGILIQPTAIYRIQNMRNDLATVPSGHFQL